MAEDGLFSREEALGGNPDRRARRLLTAIECFCAQRTARQAITGTYLGFSDFGAMEAGAMGTALLAANEQIDQLAGQDDGFDETRMLAGQIQRPYAIHQIERNAHLWAPLVPASLDVRAGVVRLLAERYRFRRGDISGIRKALGLDSEEVQATFQRRYGKPLDELYQPQVSLADQLRWGWTALVKGLDRLRPRARGGNDAPGAGGGAPG